MSFYLCTAGNKYETIHQHLFGQPACPHPRGAAHDHRAATAAHGAAQRACHHGPVFFHRHAIYRRGHGGKPRRRPGRIDRPGVDDDVALRRLVLGCRHRFFRTGGPRLRSGRHEVGTFHPTAGLRGRSHLRSAVGRSRHGHQRCPAGLARRRPADTQRRLALFSYLLSLFACAPTGGACQRYAAVQRQHAHPKPAERADVRARRRFQLFSHLPHPRGAGAWPAPPWARAWPKWLWRGS